MGTDYSHIKRDAAWADALKKQLATAPPITEERWRAIAELFANATPRHASESSTATDQTGDPSDQTAQQPRT